MKTIQVKSKSKFLNFVICFYRVSGITFGGISLDKNGNIIKSKFLNYFGWIGFCFYVIMIFSHLIHLIDHISVRYSFENTKLFIILTLIYHFISSVIITSIPLTNQIYGFKMIKTIIKYSLTKFSKLKPIIIIWIIYFTVCMSLILIQTILYPDAIHILFSLIYNLFLIPLFYSISFMSWMASVNFSENITIIRNHISVEDGLFVTANRLIQANKLLTVNYKKINQLDHYLATGFTFSAIDSMFSMMTSVYFGIYIKRINRLNELLTYGIFGVLITIQLILNCLINEKVIIETKKLQSDLDNLNIDVGDYQLYKASMSFKKSICNNKCGFTIGGFAPLNRLTLLQVKSNAKL